MSVTVSDNTVTFVQEKEQAASLALRFIAEAIVDTAEPNTPKKMGNLRRDVLKQVLGLHGEVRWQKNYAVYQEVKQYKHYTTAGTGPHYAENAVKTVVTKSDEYFRKARLI